MEVPGKKVGTKINPKKQWLKTSNSWWQTLISILKMKEPQTAWTHLVETLRGKVKRASEETSQSCQGISHEMESTLIIRNLGAQDTGEGLWAHVLTTAAMGNTCNWGKLRNGKGELRILLLDPLLRKYRMLFALAGSNVQWFKSDWCIHEHRALVLKTVVSKMYRPSPVFT